jgi:hypothetical protein
MLEAGKGRMIKELLYYILFSYKLVSVHEVSCKGSITKYDYDMAKMKSEEMKKISKYIKKPKMDKNNIDPHTGKPKVAKQGEEMDTHEDPLVTEQREWEEELENLSQNHPEFADKEFQEYVRKQ